MKEATRHERESVRRFLEHKNPSRSSSSHFVVEVQKETDQRISNWKMSEHKTLAQTFTQPPHM
jgi:hypothetical protein